MRNQPAKSSLNATVATIKILGLKTTDSHTLKATMTEATTDATSLAPQATVDVTEAVARNKSTIPYNFAKQNHLFISKETRLVCTKHTPTWALLEVKRWRDIDWRIDYIDEHEFLGQLERQYADASRGNLDVHDTWGDETMSFEAVSAALEEPEDLLASQDDAPVIKLLNAIFFEAIREQASDIHIEPFEKKLFIRFRLDGVLQTRLTTKSVVAPFLISRIKVLGKLDIAEKRLPQDGHISIKLGQRAVDLRVSTLPSAYGERAVLRLLDQQATRLHLDTLGMPPDIMRSFEKTIALPNGIVLVTGPTGSGKTTTLYGSLEKMDRYSLNIMTVEDPLEYYFEGISQTQVNNKAGMTFAKSLRAILRQDPDVIMIGEIRDIDTANIAVQASLTGHLVLSTLHTNSAIGAVTRLLDMGIEPFLLSSTLQAVLAQRLVRRLCVKCATANNSTERVALYTRLAGQGPNEDLYQAVGCDDCHHTGYKGRIGIFELISVDDTMRHMISEGASEALLKQHLQKYNHRYLHQQALTAIANQHTSVEEVVRILV